MSYSLTNPQKSIWLTEKYFSATSVNNVCGYVHILEKVNFDLLKKALNEVVKNNDCMLTRIKEENNSCIQYISEFKEFNIDIIDLSTKEDLEKEAKKFANIPLEIENNPLFKIVLFRLPNGHGGFIINVHHLIGDSWSLGLVAKESTSIYSALLSQNYTETKFPSYLEYINDENDYLKSEKYNKDKAYWNSVFETVPESASIPSFKKDTAGISCIGNRLKFNIQKNDIDKINEFCKNHRISVYNFFMAVYSIYIGRVSNLDDFVIGTPILNRTNFDQKRTMGMFVSTAPLRINLNHELSFVDFAKGVATDTLSLFRHQKYPYQHILEDLRKKDSSIPNLYNVILSYQITKTIEDSEINYTTDWIFNGNCADDIQIHLFDLNDESSMTVAYDYKSDKYDEDDISSLHSRILTMVNQIINNETIILKDIEIVTPEEKHKILYDFNNTKADYPKDKTIVDLFEEQVEKTPDNIAVVFEDQKLTYKELNEKANQLARYMLNNGINKKDIIGLRIDKSLEMIIGIIAIIKCGACYLPMNMAYPEERVNYMLEDSNCKLLLISKKSNVLSYKINSLNIDLDNTDIYKSNKKNINTIISPEDLIYIIYTSGSTGKPKGAMLCHRNVVRLMKNDNFLFDFSEKDTWTMFHSVAFDFSVWEMYGALLYGGKLVLVPDNIAKDPKLFLKLLRAEKVTILNQTPTYFYSLQNQEIDIIDNNLKIRYIIFGGEALDPSKLNQWNKKYPNTALINMYGITETTVHVTFKRLLSNDLISKTSNIGKPIPTLHVLILDKNQKLLPFETEGEMYIVGDGVFKGYLNRDELNHQKLLNLSRYSNNPIYKSADSAIMHKNGDLEYVGRIDTQVKIRGFRIELGEIENKILKYSNIENCIVCKKTSSSGRDILCAYYVKKAPINLKILRKMLSKDLPDYMIPQYFIEINEIPININGKTDFKSLPLPNIMYENGIVKPSSKIDKSIYDVYKLILGINDFSMNDSFYDLGGDSLTAITISSKLSHILSKEITVKNILEHPIISDLSEFIEHLEFYGNFKITESKKLLYYPASSAQKRMYYASSVDSNSVLYNIAGGIVVDKKLDTKKLEECFKTLISRHDVLRTHFDLKDNDIIQIIDDKIDFKLNIEKSDSNDIDNIYSKFIKPFDLTKAPLFRAKLVELNNNKTLLLLDMHHIISDGTSLAILTQELCDLYNDKELSDKQIDYKDFSIWEREQFNTDEFEKSKEYWVNQFKDEIPLLNMPTNYPRPSTQSFEGNNLYATLDKNTFDKINNLSKDLNVTPYMLMLSAYYILLSKYTSQDDIIVGTPIVGRDMPELSNMLGMFVNTLALRNKVDHNISFQEFSKNIKEHCIESFKNQTYPFDMLVKDLNLKRDTSRNPLFDVMFVFQNNGYPTINFNNAKTEYLIPNNNTSKFDLTLEVIPINNEYSMRFEYCNKLFNEDFIKRLSSHYINILNSILENKDIKIADIDMLSEEERHQILYDFNNTKVDYPRDKTIVDLFEEQVEKNPDNIAVVFEDQKLTYRELNEKANQLARFLLANQVDKNNMVCLLLDKSLEMVVSILGILKVGATFLPIDINYPKERIDYIINNSKSSILLTTQDLVNKANDTIKVLNVELNNMQFNQFSKENVNITYSTDTLAYVMYTSGSTGNPKGVMVTHKNVIRLVKNNKFIKFSKNEHILQTGSIVFDACTFEIWGALLNGFRLYIIEKEKLLDATYLKNYMKKNKITSLFITTQLFNQLIDSDIEIFSDVSNVLTGGEAVSVKHMNRLNLQNENINIIHCYGPTENTTFSTCYDVKKEKYNYTVPIGKPISNSTAYVVSSNGLLCPVGVPGELWVGGDGVAKGYLNNNDLTKDKFIPNPFGNGFAYKTGDLVKWLLDGNIEFIGRIDNQVKVRGFRIELSEIDSKILEYPNIKYSTTILNTINNEKVICSYFVAEDKNIIELDKLKEFLKKSLPNYMIPTYMLQLENFKMNINGKIDRKTLPTDFKSLKRTKRIIKPSNNTEENLLEIYKYVTNIDEISVTDDLFDDLHGDSLVAMKIQVEALSKKINIAYSDIFKYSTIRSLSNNLINNEKEIKLNNTNNSQDYSKYNGILKMNSLDYPIEIVNTPIKNILLTGFTGFLGAHILDSFMKKETSSIYCLIRSKNNMSAKERLLNVLHFYFEDKYDKFIGNRIKIVEGDISFDNFGLSNEDYVDLGNNISTVIHSAALVKHYGMYKDFENANVIGTKNVVDFSSEFNLNLLHISTLSVSGNNFADGSHVEDNFENDVDFAENNFFIGQDVEGLYGKSKFEAEHIVLDAIYNSNLKATILRMGNLTSRFSEGKFQQNHFENAFVNRFKSFLQIGYVPDYMLELYAEFTPIDFCGDAIIEIARHFNPKYTIFHLMNEKRVYLDRLFDIMKQLNINLNIVSEKEFIKVINNLLADKNKKMYIEGIINDFDKTNKHLVYESKVKVKCDFSKEYLEKLGFEWPYIDINYIRNYFKYLENIGYLNINTK